MSAGASHMMRCPGLGACSMRATSATPARLLRAAWCPAGDPLRGRLQCSFLKGWMVQFGRGPRGEGAGSRSLRNRWRGTLRPPRHATTSAMWGSLMMSTFACCYGHSSSCTHVGVARRGLLLGGAPAVAACPPQSGRSAARGVPGKPDPWGVAHCVAVGKPCKAYAGHATRRGALVPHGSPIGGGRRQSPRADEASALGQGTPAPGATDGGGGGRALAQGGQGRTGAPRRPDGWGLVRGARGPAALAGGEMERGGGASCRPRPARPHNPPGPLFGRLPHAPTGDALIRRRPAPAPVIIFGTMSANPFDLLGDENEDPEVIAAAKPAVAKPAAPAKAEPVKAASKGASPRGSRDPSRPPRSAAQPLGATLPDPIGVAPPDRAAG